jgi:protein transport protein SEC24
MPPTNNPGNAAGFYPPPAGGAAPPGTSFPPPAPGSGAVGGYSDYPGTGGAYGAPAPLNSMQGMPMGFDSGHAYNNPPLNSAPGGLNAPQSGNFPGGIPNDTSQQLPSIDEMDLSIQCDSMFMRSTTGKILSSQALSNQCKVPLGVVCHPMANDTALGNDAVEVVDFGSTGIVRCKRCRTYINPFVSWVDNGRRWRYFIISYIYYIIFLLL